MKKYVLFILAILLIAGTYGTASAEVENGAKIFKMHCAKCHGGDGSVTDFGLSLKPSSAKDLRTNRLFIDPVHLLAIIKFGRYGRGMQAWEDTLSDQEIVDVAAFVRTLKYEPDIKAGEEFFKLRCASCHVKDGSAKIVFNAPDLEMSPLGPIEMARVVKLGRHGTMMSPKRDLYRNPDLANVIAYLQSIKK
jgi:mono/diheme cytochrome c family protein